MRQEVDRLAAKATAAQNELAVVYDTEKILNQVFILEGAMTQGTCFNLAGIGLVTCAHVLASDIQIFGRMNIAKKAPAKIISQNETIDIARIDAPGLELGEGLPLGSADDLEITDKVIVAGFPNYRYGDTGTVTIGAVAGFRPVSGIRRILVDTPIIAGNSGGPVLNKYGQVIGVAVTGADRMEDARETENHGAIPIDALVFIQG